MPATRKILVVAPDEEMRRSLAFVLEAEGFRVVTVDCVPAPAAPLRSFNCAIVDETAVSGNFAGLPEFDAPVILLIDRLRHLPEPLAAWAIEKPLLGRRLVDAVAAAVRYGDSAAATA